MKKYRVKMSEDKIVGPLNSSDVKALLSEEKIDLKTFVQDYPDGDWLELGNLIDEMNSEDATFIRKLDSIGIDTKEEEEIVEEPVEPKEFPKEFKFKKEDVISNFIEDQTVIKKISDIKEETEEVDEDKTKINKDTLKYLEELKKKEAEKVEEEVLEEEVEEESIDYKNDATQMVNLADLKSKVADEAISNELAFEKEQREKEEEKSEEELENESEVAEVETIEKPKKKKKSIVFTIVVILALFLVFADEEEEGATSKKIEVLAPKIIFPQQFEVIDEKKSLDFYKKGLKFLAEKNYVSKVKAAVLLRKSTEHKFKENPAMSRLIGTYAELLPNSNDLSNDSTKIYKLIQVFKSKAISDVHFATALALFYLNIDKNYAAENTVDKFLAIESNKPSLELFGVYLGALQKIGKVEKANKVLKKLLTVEKRPLEVNYRILDYLSYLGKTEEHTELLNKLLKKNTNSVHLLLLKAKEYSEKSNTKTLAAVLKRVKSLEAERSKIYYSKYLEYMGILNALTQDFKRANGYFSKALVFNESSELRSRLAKLELSDDQSANTLISESKAIELIERSKKHMLKKNSKEAFRDALEATNIAPNYIPASLNLARLQIKNGLFNEAISLLENMQKNKLTDPEITFTLIDAYTESYKFNDVKKLLSIISASALVENVQYYNATAKYYVYKGDFINSVNWLQLAIKKNPLDENVLVEMAKILIEYRKYNKAKVFLSKLIDLNPVNFDYRVMYADILYESESPNSAVGYIYDILKFYPGDAQLLSAVGIYYYRSGQQKKYENVKKELESIPNKELSLYKFLIDSSLLDNDNQAIIKNTNKLLNIEPGNLKVRMLLGKTYMQEEKYEEALAEFKKVETRLESYPRLQYFMSKLYLLTDNNEKAIELAEKEVKANPHNIDGYVLLGDIYRKKKNYLEAEKMYKKSQQINDKDVDTLLGLAAINLKRSHFDIAIDLLKKARGIDPNNASTHKLMGDAFRKIGQSSLSIESYKIFLELSPNTRYKDEINSYIKLMQ